MLGSDVDLVSQFNNVLKDITNDKKNCSFLVRYNLLWVLNFAKTGTLDFWLSFF